jgi:hypothetical protein
VNPYQQAREIVEANVPEDSGVERAALVEAIRRAILLGQIEARQPLELTPEMAPAIVYQIVSFVDDYCARLHQSGYPVAANALQTCKRRVLAIHGIKAPESVPKKGVQSQGLGDVKRKAARA